MKRISESPIKEVVVSNSIRFLKKRSGCGKIRTLSVAPLLARAALSIHEETSISVLFV